MVSNKKIIRIQIKTKNNNSKTKNNNSKNNNNNNSKNNKIKNNNNNNSKNNKIKNNKIKKKTKKEKIQYKYFYEDENNSSATPISNKKIINYVESLTIPPAYDNVKISLNPNDDVAFIGYDKAGREQRIYSKSHNIRVTKEKYCILHKFVLKLPEIEKDINAELKKKEMTKRKLISIILKIISLCYFRVGNIKYQKKYKSY